MNIITTELNLGAKEPFTILHISDTHLTEADARNDQRKIDLAKNRLSAFPNAEANLSEIVRVSKEQNAVVINTGDITDFVSYANLDRVREFMEEVDCFSAAGNHEFSLYVGEAWEDAAYRNQSLELVQSVFKNDIRFSNRVINGINFVAVDNSYYLFEEWQLTRLKEEAKKGMPIVLCMHTPLYSEDLFERVVGGKKPGTCASLMCAPDEKTAEYEPMRCRQQRPDDITREAYEYILNEPMIKTILAGHLHFDFEHTLEGRIPQLMVGTETIRVVNIC